MLGFFSVSLFHGSLSLQSSHSPRKAEMEGCTFLRPRLQPVLGASDLGTKGLLGDLPLTLTQDKRNQAPLH